MSTQVRDVSSYRKGMLIVVFASKGKEVKWRKVKIEMIEIIEFVVEIDTDN